MMKKGFGIVVLLLGVICIGTLTAEAKDDTPAVSTQGIENLDQNVKNSKPSTEEVYNLKAIVKARKKYFKDKKAIKKQDSERTKCINEIEYLKKRLEQKEMQLEYFNPTHEKGENEE